MQVIEPEAGIPDMTSEIKVIKRTVRTKVQAEENLVYNLTESSNSLDFTIHLLDNQGSKLKYIGYKVR